MKFLNVTSRLFGMLCGAFIVLGASQAFIEPQDFFIDSLLLMTGVIAFGTNLVSFFLNEKRTVLTDLNNSYPGEGNSELQSTAIAKGISKGVSPGSDKIAVTTESGDCGKHFQIGYNKNLGCRMTAQCGMSEEYGRKMLCPKCLHKTERKE